MPSPDSSTTTDPPLLPLVKRELRALFSSSTPWLVAAAAGPLAGLQLKDALDVFSEGGVDSQSGVVVPVLNALFVVTTVAFPFVVARAAALDHQSAAAPLVWQLGHKSLTTSFAKALALFAAFAFSALPVLSVVAGFALSGGHVDNSASAALLLGHALYAVVVVGVGLCAASFTSSASSASSVSRTALVTLFVTVGLWAHDVAGKLSLATPSAALRVFARGVVDVRSALVLVIAAVVLTVIGSQLGAPASSRERRFVRAAVAAALGVAALVSVLAFQATRGSFDVSEGHGASFPRAVDDALKKIGDPVFVTVRLRADDPRAVELESAVLGPLARATVVDVTRAVDDKRYGLITYQVGTRAAESRSTKPDDVVPLVLGLAGVQSPLYVVDARLPHPYAKTPSLAYALAFVACPLLCLLGLWRARRRSP